MYLLVLVDSESHTRTLSRADEYPKRCLIQIHAKYQDMCSTLLVVTLTRLRL